MKVPADRDTRSAEDPSPRRDRTVPVNEVPDHGTITVDLAVPSSAMAVGAHPDDIDFGCGATLAKWATAGCQVHYVVLTDGARGTWDPGATATQLVTRRQDEQREAARRTGARDVTFCGWPDGELINGPHQRWVLSRLIRQYRPSVITGHDPWRRYRLHPDHRHAGFLLTDALVAARDPLFFPDQGLAPHRPNALLLWEADVVNHVEEVGGSVSDKLRALLAHTSQYESTMGIPAGEPLEPEHPATAPFQARLTDQLRSHGALADLEAGEAFHRIDRL